jgi:hypothetical protein
MHNFLVTVYCMLLKFIFKEDKSKTHYMLFGLLSKVNTKGNK